MTCNPTRCAGIFVSGASRGLLCSAARCTSDPLSVSQSFLVVPMTHLPLIDGVRSDLSNASRPCFLAYFVPYGSGQPLFVHYDILQIGRAHV